MPYHATKIFLKILSHVISSTDIFLKWSGTLYFHFSFFITYHQQSICTNKYKKIILKNIWKKINILGYIETHVKSYSTEGFLLRRSCCHFHANFFVSRHFPEWLRINHKGLSHNAQISCVSSTIFPPYSRHWFCNTAICRQKLMLQ